MSSAGITKVEVDVSTRVPSFPGVYAGIVIPSVKGPVNERQLITNQSDFLKKYTPDETIKVGYNLAHYSALAYLKKGNKLYVVRSANTALFGGVTIRIAGASSANAGVTAGIADPEAYTFDASSGDEECLLITGKNPGLWNEDLYITLTTFATDPNTVKEDGAFIITVYKASDLNNFVEQWLCSRIIGKKDGHNRNIYIEDVLLASEYIIGVDNTSIDENTYPKDQAIQLKFVNGDDGSAVADSHMISAAAELSNPNANLMTLFMDGGWTTSGYQTEIISICESRQDSFGILSTPNALEAAATYMADIETYKRTTLNPNTSYAGMFSPHVYITDKFNDRKLYVPPDGYAAGLISATGTNFAMWVSAAGNKRGTLVVEDLQRRYTVGQMDTLYDMNINPIRFKDGKGITLWGNKTLLTRPSALDRINVRLLLIQIEPAIEEALEDFLFDGTTATNRSIVTSLLESYMETIKGAGGVFDYQVTCNDENNTAEDIDNHIMNVWVFVKPTITVEFIKFTTIITKTSISFQLAETVI